MPIDVTTLDDEVLACWLCVGCHLEEAQRRWPDGPPQSLQQWLELAERPVGTGSVGIEALPGIDVVCAMVYPTDVQAKEESERRWPKGLPGPLRTFLDQLIQQRAEQHEAGVRAMDHEDLLRLVAVSDDSAVREAARRWPDGLPSAIRDRLSFITEVHEWWAGRTDGFCITPLLDDLEMDPEVWRAEVRRRDGWT